MSCVPSYEERNLRLHLLYVSAAFSWPLIISPGPDPIDLGVQVPVPPIAVPPTPRITWEHSLVLCCLQDKVQTPRWGPRPSLGPLNNLILQAWPVAPCHYMFCSLSPWSLPLILLKYYSSFIPVLSCCITVSLSYDFVGNVRDIHTCGFTGL